MKRHSHIFKDNSSTSPLSASDVLRRHEVESLKIIAILRLAMSGICIVGLTMSAPKTGNLPLSLVILLQFSVALITLMTVRRAQFPERLGFLCMLADSASIVLLPTLFASISLPVTATSLLKNDVEMFVLGFAIFNSLTLRPIQPIIIGVVSALSQIGYYLYASRFLAPIPITESPLAVFETPAIQVGGMWFNGLLLIPSLCVVLGALAYRGRQKIFETARLEHDTAALERYFSPDIVAQIRSAPDLYSKLGGQQRTIAVMFIDLRNFTQLSEQLPPEETVALLSDYFQHLADAVFEHGGSIDKFLGDGLMATFGMLGQEGQSAIADCALRAGIGIRAALAKINETREAQGKSALHQGIGIHFGTAVVGNFGTARRMEFTAVGDTVNTASRVQALCKDFHTDFLVTKAVADHVEADAFPLQSRGETSIRGKIIPIEVFEVRQ